MRGPQHPALHDRARLCPFPFTQSRDPNRDAAVVAPGRSPRFVELGWLAYGVLAAGGAKILFENLPTSRPSTMFIALAAYGAALILVPRVSRTTAQPTMP